MVLAILSPDCLFLPDGSLQPLGVDFPDTLDGFKQPRSAGDLVGFQGGRHCKADGLFGAGGVRHHQIGGQGVQMAVYALHRGIKTFQVDCQIGALRCHDSALLCKIYNHLSYYNKSLRRFQDGTAILSVIQTTKNEIGPPFGEVYLIFLLGLFCNSLPL